MWTSVRTNCIAAGLAGSLGWLACSVATAQPQQSPLGSPADSDGKFSTNYSEAVRAALPQIDAAGLRKLMTDVRRTAAAEPPLKIADLGQLEKLFSIKPRAARGTTEITDAGDDSYRFNPVTHRIYLARKLGDTKPVPREEFRQQLPAIRAAHAELAEKIGLPKDQLYFTDVREVLAQANASPQQGGTEGPILVEGVVTTMLRAVGGLLVDGSQFRAISVDANRLGLLDVRWPKLKLAANVVDSRLRAPRDVAASVIKRVTANSGRLPVNVRMAVVLRPIATVREVTYVPSLRVGVQPQSVQVGDGYRTDAGEVFYIDLMAGSPEFADPSAKEAAQSKQ